MKRTQYQRGRRHNYKKEEEVIEDCNTEVQVVKQRKRPDRKRKRPRVKPIAGAQNVVKNFGKAICSFSCLDIVKPYYLSSKEDTAKKNGHSMGSKQQRTD